jgi:hypothetical protein
VIGGRRIALDLTAQKLAEKVFFDWRRREEELGLLLERSGDGDTIEHIFEEGRKEIFGSGGFIRFER